MSQNKEPVQDLLLAEFFRKIAVSKNPMQQFYRGEIANKIVEEMRIQGKLKDTFLTVKKHIRRSYNEGRLGELRCSTRKPFGITSLQ